MFLFIKKKTETMLLLYHNKNSNYIRMLQFGLFLINKGPESVRKFIHQNLFQRNQNHNDQDTAQGIDYKLKEYNKLFKQFEILRSSSI